MGCAQSLSRRLGRGLTMFEVEVYDPATQADVSFTDLQAAEDKQRELEAAMLTEDGKEGPSGRDLAAQLHELRVAGPAASSQAEDQTG